MFFSQSLASRSVSLLFLLLLSQCIDTTFGSKELNMNFEELIEDAGGPIDQTDVCEIRANAGKCVNSEDMPRYCSESCKKWADQNNFGGPKSVVLDVDGDEDTFYDLSARLFKSNKRINFERFDGYLTVICNIGMFCQDTRDIEQTIAAMQSLFKIMPYSLNIVVFPYEIKSFDYKTEDCSGFEAAIQKANENKLFQNKLFFMEKATLNGPYVHPVYEFLKRKTDTKELIETHASFYFVNGEGTKLEVLQGASFDMMRSVIVANSKEAYGTASRFGDL